jgi:hypothetical protein
MAPAEVAVVVAVLRVLVFRFFRPLLTRRHL